MEPTKNTNKTKLFAYLRESVDLKSGIKIQEEKILKYSEVYEIEIVKWFVENDASAFKPRSEYTKMMDEVISDENVHGVICSSLSRYGRRAVDVLVDHEILTAHNKKLVIIDTPIDASTPTGKAILGNMAVFGQLERDLIVERTHLGRMHAMRVGTKSGMPMHRPPVEIDWKEYDKYYKLGLSTNAISKIITDKRTGKKISSATLYKAVKARTI